MAINSFTVFESKTAASGGTDLSLVTTGEKYTWNNPTSVPYIQVKTGTTQTLGPQMQIWVGSTAEYNDITTKDNNTLYIIR